MAKTHHAAGPLVAGVDSSTQSVKVVIRRADTGELLREGRAAHLDGTEVDPTHWLRAPEQLGVSINRVLLIGGAAWALSGSSELPQWNLGEVTSIHSAPTPHVVDTYRTLWDRTHSW
ncbi:MAG: hypothetical protein RL381_243 [Actinomycetota bacterium]|jgi:hypothetical protein